MKEIVFENVCKSYGKAQIVNNLNLTIKEGERLILLGPSGCGKSTFLRCLNGLEKINSGSIYLEDKLIGKDIAWKEAREKIGMVFQSYELFPHMNVIKNILLGPTKAQKRDPKEAEKQADELLKRVGLFERKFELPRKLSGGQKQRLSIARAIVRKPEIYIFDDSFSALDFKTDATLRAKLKEETKESVVLIVAQRIDLYSYKFTDKVAGIKVKEQKRRWASINIKNEINFIVI